MTDETRTRFLASIAAQVPIERVAEVHLFPAIRQGGMESGVAVIAVEREGEPATDAPVELESVEVPIEAEASDTPALDTDIDDEADAPTLDADLDAGAGTVEDDDTVPEDSFEQDDEPVQPRRPPRRYTVFSARYRHTLKGPDRGKWEVAVTEEADAPLLTVDAVVRGVQRRSGDAEEIVRLSGDEVRAALPVPAAP